MLLSSLFLFAATLAGGASEDARVIAAQLPTYPLETCPVGKGKLGGMGEPINFVHEGRLIRFCCGGCIKKFQADPAQYFAKVDAAVIAQQRAGYPLDTCLVSDEKLAPGPMGDPIDHVHGTRLLRFCCAGCIDELDKDPAQMMAKLDEAYIKAQLPGYPLSTCAMKDKQLGDDAINLLYGNQLVRVCCKRCAKAFRTDPTAGLKKLAAARLRTMPVGQEKEASGG